MMAKKNNADNNNNNNNIEEGEQKTVTITTTTTTPTTTTTTIDPNFDRKLEIVTAGARPYIKQHLLTRITRENCITIVNYILAMQTEVGPSERYRIDMISKLKLLAEFHNPKSFRDMTRQDIIDFLED
jgi:hypothetical protein